MTYCKTNYPNAKVHYGFVGNSIGHATSYQYADNYIATVPYMMDKFADEGAHVLYGLECVMHDAHNMLTDYVHPNLAGSQAIAQFIYNYIVKGFDKYLKSYAFTGSDGSIVKAIYDGDTVGITIDGIATASQSGTLSGAVELADITNFAVRGSKGRRAYFTMCFQTASGYQPVTCWIEENKIKTYVPSAAAITYTGYMQSSYVMSTLMA